jgi:hypothetical protein
LRPPVTAKAPSTTKVLPRSAARSSASAARMPMLSLLQMKYCTSIERRACSTSQARASNASTPVSST